MTEQASKRSGSTRHAKPGEPTSAEEFKARGQLRRQLRRRQQAKRAIIGGAVVLVLAILAWLIFGSSVFAVKKVTVDGQQILTADQVIAQAAVPIGKPLARTNMRQVSERVGQLPAVHHADAKRSWPNSVHIEVTERSPKFQIKDDAGFHWVDEQGVVFNVSVDAQAVPLVAADQANQSLLRGIADMLNVLTDDVRSQIASVDASRTNRITINLADERQIIWGNVHAAAEKGIVLGVLLKQPGKIYDVSVPSHPAIS